MRHIFVFLLGVSMSVGVSSHHFLWAAELNPDTSVLTPDSLVAAVLSRNANLAATEQAARAAAARVGPAGALDDPMISYGVAPRSIGANGMTTGQMVEIMQPIPWFGTLSTREAAASSEARAKAKSVEARRLDVIAAAKAAFAEWYFIHEALRTNGEQKAIARDLLGVAEGRLAGGGGLQQDVLQAEMELGMLEDQDLNLTATQATIAERLKALMNSAPNEKIPPPADIGPAPPLPQLEELLASVESRHPELQSVAAMVAAKQSQVKLAEKEAYPDFRVSTGYNSMWNAERMRWTVGISLNIPLNQGRRNSAISAARADERETELQLVDRLAHLRADITAAYAGASRALKSIALLEDRLLPLARDTLDVTISEYRSGGGDFLSVITAERNALTTAQSLYRARADFFRQVAELERTSGGSLNEITVMPASSRLQGATAGIIGATHE